MKLSPWIIFDDTCATRVILGTDPMDYNNRVAMIEKSGRIKVPARYSSIAKKNVVGATGLKENESVWISCVCYESVRTSPRFRDNITDCKEDSIKHGQEYDYRGFDAYSRTNCDDMLVLMVTN